MVAGHMVSYTLKAHAVDMSVLPTLLANHSSSHAAATPAGFPPTHEGRSFAGVNEIFDVKMSEQLFTIFFLITSF